MGCIGSKIFAYVIAIVNTAIAIAWFTSLGLFIEDCDNSKCFPDGYLAIILIIGQLIWLFHGYLMSYIAYKKDDTGLDEGALRTKYVVLAQLMICLSFGISFLHIIVISVSDTLIGSFSMDEEQFFVSMSFIVFFYPIILMILGYFILPAHEPWNEVYAKKRMKRKGNKHLNENDAEKQDLKGNDNGDNTNKIEIVKDDQ
mmetsp:Transcript_30752/g.27107  ORF Transcript_30752/g.27107 Transcript_30752/m.27107 type:complete len:200 (-) Transcript_30752:93-692(-)